MRHGTVLFFVILSFFILANSTIASDLQEGIFGIKWGTNINDLDNFSKLWSSSNVDFFTKPHEIHTISDVSVPQVIYGFYTNRFFAVYIKIDTIEVFDDFRRYMKSKYGIPEQTKQLKGEQTIYRWKYKDTKIKLKLNSSENTMKLAFYYTPLSKKVNEAQQEKFQKESFKFFPINKNKTPELMPLLQF